MNRPHLILLHGALASSAQFEPLIPLLEAEYQLHTPDFLGHGASAPPQSPYEMKGFAAQLVQFMDDHQLASADFFGYSMGGYAALVLAHAFPERVGRILTLATKFDWTPEGAAKEVRMLDPDKVAAKVPNFAGLLASRHGDPAWREVMTATAAMMTALGAAPTLTHADLGTIRQPVRLMVGDRDQMVGLDETAAAYRALAHGEMSVLPKTPHPLEKADPKRVAAAIRDFLA